MVALLCLALREQSYFKGVFAEASQPKGGEFESSDSDQ